MVPASVWMMVSIVSTRKDLLDGMRCSMTESPHHQVMSLLRLTDAAFVRKSLCST
jgi:hypothetical protein